MESERKVEKQERQVSEKRTAFNIKEERSAKAAEVRENSPNLMAVYQALLPGAGAGRRNPKFVTDHWGNRILFTEATIDDQGRRVKRESK